MKKILFLLSIILLLTACETKPNLMEDLTDKDIEYVEEYAKKNNLKLTIKEEYNELPINSIISQNIESGNIVEEESELIITISLGSIDEETLKEKKVNELGRIPVMMYHGIHNKTNAETNYTGGNVDKDGYQRTTEAFRNDLEFYYQNGYRMISLKDYIDGNIDVELGYSPIVLTFDDGLENNIKVTGLDENGDIIIDPNSAVGILEEFKNKYSDYNVTATFFVNGGLFNQKEYNEKILNWLVDHGYDVGNHSYNHANFTKIDSDQSIKEIGSVYKLLDSIIPDKYVNIVALPYGTPYKDTHDNFKHIISGNYEGYEYVTNATLRVGWEADYSPFSTSFNSQFIKRIRAYDNNGVEFDIQMNFKLLESNRYISDGNKDTITIKKEDSDNLKNTKELKVVTY